MIAGTLTGIVITLIGAAAGVALLAAHVVPALTANLVAWWAVYVAGFCMGPVTTLVFCKYVTAHGLLRASGVFCLALGFAAAVLAMASLSVAVQPPTMWNLWLLAAVSLGAGVALFACAALAGVGKGAQQP